MDAVMGKAAVVPREGHAFYLWMAGVFVVVAFGGFTPSYWAKIAAGTFNRAPIFHIHGMLFFFWTLFYFAQTAWVANGRIANHRAWGLAGIALFSVMMCSVLVGQVTLMGLDDRLGIGEAGRRFSAVALCAMPVLIGFFTLAIVNVRRPAVHKRFMVLLMAGCMTPAIARVFIALFARPGSGPPPPFVSIPPALLADLFIAVAMLHDWRTRGRPHAVYAYGGSVLFLQQMITPLLASTSAWMAIAKAVQGLGG